MMAVMKNEAAALQKEYPLATIELQLTQQYSNMKSTMDKHPIVVQLAQDAYTAANVPWDIIPIRGGTDGSRLCEMGLPCPNIFAGNSKYYCTGFYCIGGINFHSKREFEPVVALVKGVDVVFNLCCLWAKKADVDC